MSTLDYYRVLGVDQHATEQQIKEAYRKLAIKYHPDRNRENPESLEMMKQLNEAYAVLSNPQKRQDYDALKSRYGSAAHTRFRQSYSEQDIFRGSDIHQVFEEMARSFGIRGVDEIFREFYGSGYRRFEFQRPGFFARGFVFTGPGRGGGRRHLHGRQPRGLGRLARLLLKNVAGVEVPEKGADIHDTIRIPPELAAEGGPYAYYLREKSKKLIVKIPRGVRDGQHIRLSGMGKDGSGGAQAGDLLLKVTIRAPWSEKIKNFARNRLRPSKLLK
jgi:DnaJ-class molecular chaperone